MGMVASVSRIDRLSAQDFGSVEVMGISEIKLNEETVKEALRMFLAERVFDESLSVLVKSFSLNGYSSGEMTVALEVTEKE